MANGLFRIETKRKIVQVLSRSRVVDRDRLEEEHPPRELIRNAERAEEAGFMFDIISEQALIELERRVEVGDGEAEGRTPCTLLRSSRS